MSKRIPLTQGKFAIIDDTDFEWLNQWKWYYRSGYAVRASSRQEGKRQTIWMHREILDTPFDMDTDHRNNVGTDNQRRNLRICTRRQNLMNTRKHPGCSSQYKGVSRCKRAKKWRAYIQYDGKLHGLGYFINEKEAALVYDREARKRFGAFAKPNFTKETIQCFRS